MYVYIYIYSHIHIYIYILYCYDTISACVICADIMYMLYTVIMHCTVTPVYPVMTQHVCVYVCMYVYVYM